MCMHMSRAPGDVRDYHPFIVLFRLAVSRRSFYPASAAEEDELLLGCI